MWFGQKYFTYIPKEALLSFQNGFETIELEDGSLRITLYEKIGYYDNPENRKIQWDFRRKVGMDHVAHQLLEEPIIDEFPDPSIQINTENLQHGGIRGITYYFNNFKEVVPRSKATSKYSYEVDCNGDILWSEIVKI
jgi:hypothetical protein